MSDASLRVAIGADHSGFELKQRLARWLKEHGYAVEDCGVFDTQPADYPVIAASVARKVASSEVDRGIVIDGAGIGSSMVANKFPGVRAALCYDLSSARNSREHNDANVLTMGAGLIGASLAEQIVEAWLGATCTVDRHLKRVAMIDQVTKKEEEPVSPTGPIESTSMSADNLRNIPGLGGLSDGDLEKIVARVAELMSAGGSGWPGAGACACCGDNCQGRCAEKSPATVRDLISMGAGRIGLGLGGGPIAKDVAQFIDHTLLKPEATSQQIEQLCKEALEFGFASVCINPSWVRLASSRLKGSATAVCTVAGFPLGAHTPEVKAFEARQAIREGAREIDMVINIGALKSGDDEAVYRDIKAVVDACNDGRAICKVILECALLTDDEKVRACKAARRARADFVKTSTGFSTHGATAGDVALMAEAVRGTRMGVKAAGGIRNYDDLKAMVQAGATRIGASAGVQIVKEAKDGKKSEAQPPATKEPQKY